MNKYSPIKIILKVSGLALLSLVLYYAFWMLFDKELRYIWPFTIAEMAVDYLMCLIMSFAVSLFYWRTFIKIGHERDRFKLKSLENQINPHFVFNNFSILSELINEDKDKAQQFLMNLSKVYRYNLNIVDRGLVPIADELSYLSQYSHILETRFGKSFMLYVDENLQTEKGYIAPCSLQMLVENAIKHNEHTIEHPLMISIDTDGTHINVSNVIQPLPNEPISTNVGNKNLMERYSLLSKDRIIIENDEKIYKVSLPIIKSDKI